MIILARAMRSFPSHLKEYESHMMAGAFFPDAFYNCKNESEAAEIAHWPPFLAKGVEVWKEKYGSNWKTSRSKDSLALQAFLYGILTHQIADVSWHSLGQQQGLLAMLAENEFRGNFTEAHKMLDVGGDMIMLDRYGSSKFFDVGNLPYLWAH